DGMKVDTEGRVFCTGPGGTWVFSPEGKRLGIIRTPEVPANLAFGGPDLKTLFLTARTSVYTLQVKAPGLPHPAFRSRGRRHGYQVRHVPPHAIAVRPPLDGDVPPGRRHGPGRRDPGLPEHLASRAPLLDVRLRLPARSARHVHRGQDH